MMLARYVLDSFTHAITSTLGTIWQSAKNYLMVEPAQLWQQVMGEWGLSMLPIVQKSPITAGQRIIVSANVTNAANSCALLKTPSKIL